MAAFNLPVPTAPELACSLSFSTSLDIPLSEECVREIAAPLVNYLNLAHLHSYNEQQLIHEEEVQNLRNELVEAHRALHENDLIAAEDTLMEARPEDLQVVADLQDQVRRLEKEKAASRKSARYLLEQLRSPEIDEPIVHHYKKLYRLMPSLDDLTRIGAMPSAGSLLDCQHSGFVGTLLRGDHIGVDFFLVKDSAPVIALTTASRRFGYMMKMRSDGTPTRYRSGATDERVGQWEGDRIWLNLNFRKVRIFGTGPGLYIPGFLTRSLCRGRVDSLTISGVLFGNKAEHLTFGGILGLDEITIDDKYYSPYTSDRFVNLELP